METQEGKQVYRCEKIPYTMLMGTLDVIANGFGDECRRLRRCICSIPVNQIPWSSVRTLCVLGRGSDGFNEMLEKERLMPGSYVNHDGSVLLFIRPKEAVLQTYLSRHGESLKAVVLYYTVFKVLNVSALTALELLHIVYSDKLSEIRGLERLSSLEELRIGACGSLSDMTSLEKLPQLKNLQLSQCDRITQLPGLGKLAQLQNLRLSYCNGITELSGLEELTSLNRLILRYCRSLTQLQGFENLRQLTFVSIARCDSLMEIPIFKNLPWLSSVELSKCGSLTQLHGFENLPCLTGLDLSGCHRLTEFPPTKNLPCLTNLNFSGSGLRELPGELRRMKSLRQLDLSNMSLRDLPDWLPKIAEKFSLDPHARKTKSETPIVYLGGTTVEEIRDMSIFEQPYEMVVKWFEDRKRGRAQTLNEIKVVFLGDGEAGKSHTIARLMNDGGDPVDYVDTATPGIVIKHRKYTLDDREFRVHYWDFGGQEIMHSMHRIFLTGRTMYVVLINARDDTQSDRTQYWLHNIQSFAPNAPVLLVLNKIDQNPKASIDERTLRSRYSGLTQVVRLSALKFGQDEFNDAFTYVLLDEISKTGFLDAQWPASWIRVKEQLEAMKTHYILGHQYKALCRRCQVNDLQTELLHWFNDLGVSFCFCDKEDYKLKKHVILRPDWITNGLYIILFNECPGAHNGQIPHAAIYDLLERASCDGNIRCTLPGASYDNPGDVEYVLGVMRKFQLSLNTGDGNEFIPMLCQQDSTVDIHYYERDAELLEFRMDFEYLPDNLLHRLMVERYAELDKAHTWRKGARFEVENLGYSAIVMIDGRQLRFFIRHTDPMHRPNTYLTMLKANVDRIWKRMGLEKPTSHLIYKVNGQSVTFRYDRLLKLRKKGRREEYCEELDEDFLIEDILNQSAPDSLDDEAKLLSEITRSCRSIQDEPIYRLIKNPGERGYTNGPGMEDLRNRRVRDDLLRVGFKVADQSQRGSSGSGKSIGEPDLLVLDEQGEPWTVIEALRVSDDKKTAWNAHLDKLLNKYNSRGLPRLYLLTYVDADPVSFSDIWEGYQAHIEKQHPGQFRYAENSLQSLNGANSPQYIKTARCRYSCGGDSVTVYHIFVQIPMQSE